MTVKIIGGKPVEFFPLPKRNVLPIKSDAGAYLDSKAEEVKEFLCKPLFAGGASIDIDGATEDETSLALRFAQRFADEIMNVEEDEILAEVIWQSDRYLSSNPKPLNFQFTLERLNRHKLPCPTNVGQIVKYIPSDCIMSGKALLSDFKDNDARSDFCANLGAYFDGKIPAKVLCFENQTAFEHFKEIIANQQTLLSAQMSPDANKLIADFLTINLDEIAEGILLRLPEQILDDEHKSNEAFSFARVLENCINMISDDDAFEVPVHLSEMFFMTNLMCINLELLARASDREFKKAMKLQIKGFNQARKLKLVSNKALKKADKVARSATKNAGRVRTTRENAVMRAARRKFAGKPATSKELLKMITKVIENRTTSQMTSNTYIQTKPTYMRPNRRDPNNVNLIGKMKSVRFRPDIHVYIDTSGSISEDMYRDAVGTLIALAKKMQVNMYITSFSHIISQTNQLHVQGRKISDVYKEFMKIEKVQGGTNYELVWDKVNMLDKINQKNNRSYQINFMITDFEYWPPRGRVFTEDMPCVKNMYYLPMTVGRSEYSWLVKEADAFASGMEKLGDVNIRKRILMP